MRYAAVAELADAQDLKSCGTNLPYRFDSGLRHLKTLDFSRVLFFFRCLSIYCFQYVVKLLYNLDTMNEELFEVVNFVATTHPLGQKRCRRGDACRITSHFLQILEFMDTISQAAAGGFLIELFLRPAVPDVMEDKNSILRGPLGVLRLIGQVAGQD